LPDAKDKMANPEFPANSNVSRGGSSDKKLKRITSGEVRTRKRSVRRQFQEAFVVGDTRTAVEYMLFEVALPSMRDAVVDSLIGGIERLFQGDSRRRGAGEVSVADLYELLGVAADHTDQKWGWRTLGGASVRRVRDGYLLDLPQPEPI
jgi:hypothetical protein